LVEPHSRKIILRIEGVGKNANTPLHAYVLIDADKAQRYQKKVAVLGGSLNQEGAIVLYKGDQEPPQEIRQQIDELIRLAPYCPI
jgi:hypothetical protein